MTQIIIQGREVGIPTSVRFIVPDLTGNEVQIAGEAAEGSDCFYQLACIRLTHRATKPSSRITGRNMLLEPDPWAAQSYATLYILAEAIANAQSTEATAVRDELAKIMNFPTVLGQFSFNEVGDAVYDPIVLIVENGELVDFE